MLHLKITDLYNTYDAIVEIFGIEQNPRDMVISAVWKLISEILIINYNLGRNYSKRNSRFLSQIFPLVSCKSSTKNLFHKKVFF